MKNKIKIEDKILIAIVSIFVISVLGYAFNRFYIERDYSISQHVSCDPEMENCFVWQCDPAAEKCSENPDENIDFYKKIDKKASAIPECSGEACEDLQCEPNEVGCVITSCSPSEAEARGVTCSNDLPKEETEGESSETEESPETEEANVLES